MVFLSNFTYIWIPPDQLKCFIYFLSNFLFFCFSLRWKPQNVTSLITSLREQNNFLTESLSDMSGKGCQLMVSPSRVSPPLKMTRGHQSQYIRMPAASPDLVSLGSSLGRPEEVKAGNGNSFTAGKQNGSHVVLPALSLRRQVLINGKHLSGPTASLATRQPLSTTAPKLSRLLPPDNRSRGKYSWNLTQVELDSFESLDQGSAIFITERAMKVNFWLTIT